MKSWHIFYYLTDDRAAGPQIEKFYVVTDPKNEENPDYDFAYDMSANGVDVDVIYFAPAS